MFFFFVVPKRGLEVRLRGLGTFFCLNCEKTRPYERRECRKGNPVRLLSGHSGDEGHWTEFILCVTCEAAFSPECLNESTDAYLHELLLDNIPVRAIYLKFESVHVPPSEAEHEPTFGYYEDYSRDGSVSSAQLVPAEEIRVNLRSDSLIAYTAGRRH